MNIGRRVSAATRMAAAEHLYESYLKPLMEEEIRNSNLSYAKIAASVQEKTIEEWKETNKELSKIDERQRQDLEELEKYWKRGSGN